MVSQSSLDCFCELPGGGTDPNRVSLIEEHHRAWTIVNDSRHIGGIDPNVAVIVALYR
jgi:hypothetical protein